jgi:hypothetical protein
MGWKPQIQQQIDQLADIDGPPDIVVLALGEDELRHLETLSFRSHVLFGFGPLQKS